MAKDYGTIEDAIVTALKEGESTPFKTVVALGAHLSNAQMVEEIQQLSTRTPAAAVMADISDTNLGNSGSLKETVDYLVIIVAATASRDTVNKGDDARPGLYDLWLYARNLLHNNRTLSSLINPLLFAGSRRLPFENLQLTVAARILVFQELIVWPDGPS